MDQTVTLPQPSDQQFAPAKQVQRAKIQNPQNRTGSGNHKGKLKKDRESQRIHLKCTENVLTLSLHTVGRAQDKGETNEGIQTQTS